ncbi:uncharacterized protein [Paramisgurnus dabryanus]|uniref:uncharacterized protein n=1 Tax=Paramisgurnus dabryanus TaxID=90735 RepID=UPI003CCF3FE4
MADTSDVCFSDLSSPEREAVEELLPGIRTRRYSVPHITLAPGTRRRSRHATSDNPSRCSFTDRVRANGDAIAQHENGETPLVIVTCTTCHMYSLASSVSTEGFTCVKCIEVVRLTEKVAELEAHIRTLVEDSKTANVNVSNTVSGAPTVTRSTHSSVSATELTRPTNWVTIRRRSHIRCPSKSPLVISNRFDILSNTLAETSIKGALVIGDSILKNVNIEAPATIVDCIPGARSSDIRSKLKVLANAKRKFSKIVIHAGANDTRLRQSEITKDTIKEVCEIAKTMSDNVICSGPLPAYRGDETYSRLASLHHWLSKWCPQHNVGFIDNWKHFRGRPDLLKRDGLHPSSEGNAILSRNLTNTLNSNTV